VIQRTNLLNVIYLVVIFNNGNIKSNCEYAINKLEDMKEVICYNKKCKCNYDNYKEVIR